MPNNNKHRRFALESDDISIGKVRMLMVADMLTEDIIDYSTQNGAHPNSEGTTFYALFRSQAIPVQLAFRRDIWT